MPRWGSLRTKPSISSSRSASRTGPWLVPYSLAMCISMRRSPGPNSPSRIPRTSPSLTSWRNARRLVFMGHKVPLRRVPGAWFCKKRARGYPAARPVASAHRRAAAAATPGDDQRAGAEAENGQRPGGPEAGVAPVEAARASLDVARRGCGAGRCRGAGRAAGGGGVGRTRAGARAPRPRPPAAIASVRRSVSWSLSNIVGPLGPFGSADRWARPYEPTRLPPHRSDP